MLLKNCRTLLLLQQLNIIYQFLLNLFTQVGIFSALDATGVPIALIKEGKNGEGYIPL